MPSPTTAHHFHVHSPGWKHQTTTATPTEKRKRLINLIPDETLYLAQWYNFANTLQILSDQFILGTHVVLHLKNLCVTNGNITTVSVIQYTTVYPSCIQINNWSGCRICKFFVSTPLLSREIKVTINRNNVCTQNTCSVYEY